MPALLALRSTVRIGSFFTVQRPLQAKQKSGRSPLEKSSLNDAGDVAGGDDQVVRRFWL
jgi:hypothetical protein